MMEEKASPVAHATKHSSQFENILEKMGRVLAKKRALDEQRPRLVYDDRLWLGNFAYASDKNFLKEQEISTVVSCLQIAPAQRVEGIEYKECYLKDGEDTRFQRLLEEFDKIVSMSKGNVYVHCFSGRSRSVALVLSLFMRHKKLTYDQAHQRLAQLYPFVQPNNYFQKILRLKQDSFIKEECLKEIGLVEHEPIYVVQATSHENNLLDREGSTQNVLPKTSPKKETIHQADQETGQVKSLQQVVSNPQQNNVVEVGKQENSSIDAVPMELVQHKVKIESDNMQAIQSNQKPAQVMNLSVNSSSQSVIDNSIGLEDNKLTQDEQKPEKNDFPNDQPSQIYSKQLEVTKIEVASYMQTEATQPTQVLSDIQSVKTTEQKPSTTKVEEVIDEDDIVEKGDFTQKKRKPKKKKK